MTDQSSDNRILRENFVFNNWQKIRDVLQQAPSKEQTRDAARGDEQTSKEENALRDYFGDERYTLIRNESLRAQTENIHQQIGNVIVLPGIMGSHLSVVERNQSNQVTDIDHIWLNLWRIVKGDMERLRPSEKNPEVNLDGERIEASGVIGWYYGLAIEALQAVPFPYDWRLDIFDTADKLKKFIDERFRIKGTPDDDPKYQQVKFVAHSMGGLVVRAFIAKYPKIWEKLDSHLIMLGTPNAGSYAAVKGLMGKNETARKLAKVDLFHSLAELSEIINSFYGLYQLCPSKSTSKEIYQQSFWQNFTDVQFQYLTKVADFHQKLLDEKETFNCRKMTYIAGAGFETPVSLTLPVDGAYDFKMSLDGDGTVSHELGLLNNVPTYFVKETHADLLNNSDVLNAVKDIFLKRSIKHLTKQKPQPAQSARSLFNGVAPQAEVAGRGANDDVRQAEIVARKIREIANEVLQERETQTELRSAEQQNETLPRAKPEPEDKEAARRKKAEEEEKDIKDIRSRGNKQGLDQALVYEAEKKLLRSLLNSDLDKPPDPRAAGRRKTAARQGKTAPKIFSIRVRLLQNNIQNADAPVIVAGQYQDLPPKGAIGAVDQKIGNLISLAHQNNMFAARLGELFAVPVKNEKLFGDTSQKQTHDLNENVEIIMVAGMGQFNGFKRDALRLLMMNSVLGTLAMGYKKLATVLIGSNLNRYSIEDAVLCLFKGVSDAFRRLPNAAIENFEMDIYEIDQDRIESAKEIIDNIQASKIVNEEMNNIKIEFVGMEKNPDFADGGKASRRNTNTNPPDNLTRLTFRRNNGFFQLSALTASAAVPERRVEVQSFIVESLIEELRMPQSLEEQVRFGKLLHILAIPEEFQGYIDSSETLVLLLNREAAAIPWELVKYGSRNSTKSFGIDLNVTRQFSSDLAPVPGVPPPLNSDFKALIIADPAEDLALRLPGARMEGEQLRIFFEKLRKKHRRRLDDGLAAIDFQIDYRIGYEQCNFVEILSLIATEEYDLVHFAGHGIFNEKEPNKSGWIFGRDAKSGELIVLSAKEIFPLRRVPRIVFSNACFSAQLGSTRVSDEKPTIETGKNLAGLAEAFFLHGIDNYIGTGWQVSDIYAVNFAKKFYEAALDAKSSADSIGKLSKAMQEARKLIYAQTTEHNVLDSTWGAYQHYGNPNDRLVRLDSAQPSPVSPPPVPPSNDGVAKTENPVPSNGSDHKAATELADGGKPGRRRLK